MKYRGLVLSLSMMALVTACGEQEVSGDRSVTRQTSQVKIVKAANDAQGTQAAAGDPQALLNTYCVDCHGPDRQKGNVRLDNLSTLAAAERTELMKSAHEVIHFEEMPPSNKPQPTEAERELLNAWLTGELEVVGGSEVDDKLRYPQYGNVVDHETLFSGEIKEKAYTPARRWLVSPQIFHQRVIDVLGLEGREWDRFQTQEFFGVTNPFILPDHSGVRDYDIYALNGGHLLIMLNNAQWIADKQIHAARIKKGEVGKDDFDNPKDRWYPRETPEALEAVILAEGTPSDELLIAAIQDQFNRALGRDADGAEVEKYLKLTRDSIAMAGNSEGLRQMLIAVMLESEFMYRYEFGAGEEDTYGRKLLAPREAAYAISYALGDRKPDEQLLTAAAEGRLQTKADFKREVERLLADQNYYRGQVDPKINGGHYKSNETSHPKIVRFFREFFGYRAAANIFKDPHRSGARYQNLERGTMGTPGWLIREADLIVTYHVENDQDVFENLLGSDKYFVYDQYSGEKGKAILAEWELIWNKLKDTPWQTEPMRVLEENLEFIKEQKSLRIDKIDDRKVGDFVTHMRYFSEYFPQGKTPFPRVPWSHGYYINHSTFYSLPPTPMRGRYYPKPESPERWASVEKEEFWDYEIEQPFSIPHRKGILSHPAWLIAHSHNFHTDPIKRGRWIREKLLAGRVPDVPITVDAQVPEDPHRTFRERLEDVTAPDECWKCHQHMNPLGLPFEIYDDFGRYRTEELMEHPDNLIKAGNGKTTFDEYPTEPIVSTGHLDGTDDPKLDGEVEDALDLIDRLAKSERARQSIIRHAFRFYMGRNETLADSQTLIDADQAYLSSGGSFKAVIVSLLTSDSFMYRKEIEGK